MEQFYFLISLFVHFNLGSFIIEVFWIIITIYGIVVNIRKKKRKKYMKTILLICLFLTNILFANYSYTNKNSGKIDMHGGKGENLLNQKIAYQKHKLQRYWCFKTSCSKSSWKINQRRKKKKKLLNNGKRYKFISWNVNGIRAVDKKGL